MPAYQAVTPYDPTRGRPVHPLIAGTEIVSTETLEAKLGHTAFAVWRAMLQCRSEDGGVCHATITGLAKRAGRKAEAVRYGLKRLKAAKLVADLGWRIMTVFTDGTVGERRVYVRTVRGALRGYPVIEAVVPSPTHAWLDTANTHGGPRIGNQSASLPVCLASVPAAENTSSRVASLPVPPSIGGASLPTDIYMEDKTHETTPSPSGKTDGGAVRGTSVDIHVQPTNGTPRERLAELINATLRTPKPNVASPILVGGPLPPYPNSALVNPVVTPKPPMVDATADDYDKARMLVNAYCGACSTRLGEQCRILRGEKSLRSSRYFSMLVQAANLLHEKKISPFAWAAWWLDGHVRRGRTDRPPIQVLFGNASVGDHVKRAMFRRSGKIYGGRVVFGELHSELIRRYEDMRQHLRTIAFSTEADVASIVAEHFPPGEWGLLLEGAQKEAAALKAKHTAALQRGEFLW